MNTAWVKQWKENHERGAQLVELALVFVLLALLVAGVWDLGRMFRGYITIANAARDGVRYAIRMPCTNNTQRGQIRTAIQNVVIAEAAGSGIELDRNDITINPVDVSCPTESLRDITVTVTYPHTMWMSGITGLSNITLRATASMRWFGNDTG